MRMKHRELFAKFSSTFKPETVAKWEAMVKKWETNPLSKPNPFEEPTNCKNCHFFVSSKSLMLSGSHDRA